MKKLLTALLAVMIALPFSASFVMAQESAFKNPDIQSALAGIKYSLLTNQPTGEQYSNFSFKQILINMGIFSTVGGEPIEVVGIDGQTKITYSKGMVGDMSEVIAWMYNSPAATTERYVADVLNSAGIVQPAYAQGLGFASLDPVLNTWKTFRNMAYLFFVVVFMVIGFLIMMRQKVGGQTVVTAQQAIPHIIVALLLVTFSYAIAGLLIDMMYLVMYLLLALFNRDQESFLNKNFLTLGWTMVSNGSTAAYKAVEGFSESMKQSLGDFGADAVGFLGGLTLAVVVAIAITMKIFELFFELLKTYVIVILTIAFAPILLALGAVPGKNTFGQWIKDLIGNLAAFPAVMLVLIIFDELTGGISGGDVVIESGGFQPPYLFGSGSGGALPFMVGVGMLMIMPEIVKQAKTAMGAKEGIFAQFARDIGQSAKKGWTGGEIIPGLGFTDTSKWAGGGISGSNIVRKAGIGMAGAITGAPVGLYEGIRDRQDKSSRTWTSTKGRVRQFSQYLGDKLGDEQINSKSDDKKEDKH